MRRAPLDFRPYLEPEPEEAPAVPRGPKVSGGGAPPAAEAGERRRVHFEVPDPEPLDEEGNAGGVPEDHSRTECFVSFVGDTDPHGFKVKTSRTTGEQYIYDTEAIDEYSQTHAEVRGRQKSYAKSRPTELYVDAYDDIDPRKYDAPPEVRDSFARFLDEEFEALAPRVPGADEEEEEETERVDVGGSVHHSDGVDQWDTLRALSSSYRQYLLKSVNVELGFKGLYHWLQPICNIADVEKRPVQSLASVLFTADLHGGVPYGFDTYINDVPIRHGEQMLGVTEEEAAISFRLRVKFNSMQDDEQAEAIEGAGMSDTVLCVGRDLQDWTCDFLSCVIIIYATNETRIDQARRCAQLLPEARQARDIQVAIGSAKFETML